MKAILLAAGVGSRISRHIQGKPKCTLDIGGISLIEYTVRMLMNKGLEGICIVVGYKSEVLKHKLKDYDIQFYFNPFFDITNSIASLWFARDFYNAGDDLLIMNGDVFVEEAIIDILMNEKRSPVLLADSSRKLEADYKLSYRNDILINYGKDLPENEISGEYVGIAKFNSDFTNKFIDKHQAMIENQRHCLWWEDVIYACSREEPVYVKDIAGYFWAEVDFIEDYQRILRYRGVKDGINQ